MTTVAASPQPPYHRGITSPGLKAALFALVGMNSMATTYFFYYLYFYTQARLGFGELRNLLLAALLGFAYAGGSFAGGRFAQKSGYLFSVRVGLAVMIAAILAASQVEFYPVVVVLAAAATIGMSFTWPALEALMSEGEAPGRLQSLVGIYNFTWAVTGAFAYFTGGAMVQNWGFGAIFFVPVGLMAAELVLMHWLEKQARLQPPDEINRPLLRPMPDSSGIAARSRTFLKMGWVANPFAYLTVNTMVATIPSLAKHQGLTPRMAGFVCSVWLFARAGAFVALRLWPKWHYRFGFLAGAYATMIVCFAATLLVPVLWVMVSAQIVLGLALGLIYYSSLYYSMDMGDTKGEHGGIHESVIGAGNGAGPAIAAIALSLFPSHRASGPIAVCAMLLLGLGGLFWLRFREGPHTRAVKPSPPTCGRPNRWSADIE
jgi:MFS family permease